MRYKMKCQSKIIGPVMAVFVMLAAGAFLYAESCAGNGYEPA